MPKTNQGNHNVEFHLNEGSDHWALPYWDPTQCEIIPCKDGDRRYWGVMDWSIQTLVASSDSKYCLNEWLREQEDRPFEDADIPEWIEDAAQEIKRLKAALL